MRAGQVVYPQAPPGPPIASESSLLSPAAGRRPAGGAGFSPPPPRTPADAERSVTRLPAGAALEGLLLGLLTVLDDVARLEQDALRDLAPRRRPAQKELQVHAEVLVLL